MLLRLGQHSGVTVNFHRRRKRKQKGERKMMKEDARQQRGGCVTLSVSTCVSRGEGSGGLYEHRDEQYVPTSSGCVQ